MATDPDKPPRPAKAGGADYPVDPAERLNQEARLRKAAAAGASPSNAPIPGLMLRRSSAVPASPQPAESQTALSKSPSLVPAAPKPSEDRNLERKDNDQVLAELRKISAWADLQRKITKWALIFLAALVVVMIGVFVLMARDLKPNLESDLPPHQPDWYDVDRKVHGGEFEKAIAIGEELIVKAPQSPEAHMRLAGAYLATGNLEKAREHYAEAFRLFPSEENEKLLSAIEKRTKADKP